MIRARSRTNNRAAELRETDVNTASVGHVQVQTSGDAGHWTSFWMFETIGEIVGWQTKAAFVFGCFVAVSLKGTRLARYAGR